MSTDRLPSAEEIKAAQDALAQGEGESIREPAHPVHKQLVGVLGVVLTLLCLGWVANVPYYFGGAFYQEQFLASVLGLALALGFNAVDRHGKPHAKFSPVDFALGALGLGAALWIAVRWDDLLQDVSYRTPETLILSGIMLVLVLEALRRCTGWGLLSVVLGFFLYAMVAHWMPDVVRGKPQNPEGLLVYLAFDPSALYGSPLVVGSTIVIMFIWLGDVLIRSGGGEFFKDIAVALMGRKRGGPAKICVVGSALFGTISGSAVSNVASVGVFTIPMMKRTGYSARDAGAIEAVGSTGGQLMPPVMGAAAFLMAEFLGVPYWDVVIRGFALAFIYYISIGAAVYLLCVRLLPDDPIDKPQVPLYDKISTAIFFTSVLYLVYLMGYVGKGELLAALYTAMFMLAPLIGIFLYFKHVLKEPKLQHETLFGSLRRGIETHAEMSSYLTLLLATLGIMIGLFTVTGFINRMGGMLIDLGSWNIIAMIGMAWVFGWLAGTGLPPTATYIIGAVVIVPPMRELGINPWVAHFFVFFLSVWGELSPPTSLTAAVSARIANASFMRTMWEALKICAPITLMTFAIFTRHNLVTNPGWLMIADMFLVLVGTLGASFAMFGRCYPGAAVDIVLRCLFAVLAFAVLFVPDIKMSVSFAVVLVIALAGGIWQHRKIAPPKKYALTPQQNASTGDLAPVLAEAKRDIG
jgi:TRAP transporter 4TM/12TM fusion protein